MPQPQRAKAIQPAPRRRRITGDARREAILARAAELFAAQGFGASTRDLARALGVTQALLYRYFPSKQALIDAAIERQFSFRPNADARPILADQTTPLASRLIRFYSAYLAATSEMRARLWMQCALAGQSLALRTGVRLTETVLAPIAAELRRACGLPDFSAVPFSHQERELVMVLHGGMAFLAIRKHVYRMKMALDLEALIGQLVQVWLTGARKLAPDLVADRAHATPLLRRRVTRPP